MRSRTKRMTGSYLHLLLTAAVPVVALSSQIAHAQTEQAAPSEAASAEDAGLGEIVVTATRQAQVISRVPISISAYNQESMEVKGMKSFEDVARFTPGVRFDPASNAISIRGISGGAGAGTTGIYIDDTPIQIRGLGFNSDESLPAIFDLDRVEVLRGPQGTLFGAGSEGGTVRFITPQPSLTKFSTYDRAEISTTAHGGMNWEAGAAIGAPIVEDKLGVRVSAWHRRDGGYIDHVNNATGQVDDKNINDGEVTVLRGAVAWQAADGLLVTPSVYYQRRTTDAWNSFFAGLSDPGSGKFRTSSPEYRDSFDRFVLPTLNVRYDVGEVSVIGNASYFNRRNRTGYDGTVYYLSYWEQPGVYPGPFEGNPIYPFLLPTGINPNLPAFFTPSEVINTQRVYTGELRLQSNAPDSRLNWVAGVFYQRSRQLSSETLFANPGDDFYLTVFGLTTEEIFGYPNPFPGVNYNKTTVGIDKQIAGFLDITYEIVDGLKLTAGARYAEASFSFNTLESAAFAPEPSGARGRSKEHPFTPKVGINYQIDRNNLVYATWSKGYRVGGANAPVNQVLCAEDLALLGLSGSPDTYDSDTVNSIELGSKLRLLGNKLQLAGSVYRVNWNGIQQNVLLASCGIQFIANLGKARSRGFDLQASLAPIDGLTFDAAVGYNHARLTEDVALGPGVTSARKGDAIEGPPWTVSLGAQYEFPIADNSFYLRGDLQYLSRLKRATAGRNPLNLSGYTPGERAPAARTNVSLRAGVMVGAANVSVFVDNLFDSSAHLSYAPVSAGAVLETQRVVRPRVIGLTVAYRR